MNLIFDNFTSFIFTLKDHVSYRDKNFLVSIDSIYAWKCNLTNNYFRWEIYKYNTQSNLLDARCQILWDTYYRSNDQTGYWMINWLFACLDDEIIHSYYKMKTFL